MNGVIRLCQVEEIPDGEARGFDPEGVGRDTLFVVRQGSRLYGWKDQCPHEGVTPLPWRRHAYLNAKKTRLVCFAHGAQFDIASGVCVLGPCIGEALSPVDVMLSEGGDVLLRQDDSGSIREDGR
jgi:nitrite reductase/ring-hydroxylating ferredoxin subunit